MTHPSPALGCFLYHSQLSAAADITCIADIVKTARNANQTLGITGLLVFDGLRFCQYIEGPAQPLEALIECISRDPRHTAFTPQHHAPLEADRLFADWSMAYVVVDEEEPLQHLVPLRGMQAVQQLTQLVPSLDAV